MPDINQKPDLNKMLKEELIFLDGAAGTFLQKAGMPSGVCPELWILEHEDVICSLQEAYVRAGTQILYAPTFSGNPIKLEEYGVAHRLSEINGRLVELTRRAAGGRCLVAGDLTMTGRSLSPVGDLAFEALVDCYKAQVRAIAEAGVDLFVIETMMSLQETRAAVLAVKESTKLPVFATITLEQDGRTLYGTDPVTALVTLEALGVDAFGINCSCGPDTLLPVVKELSEYAKVPLIVKPNAGLPRLEDGSTVFDMQRDEFAGHMAALIRAGASIVGGCCGTDPSYIAAMKAECETLKPLPFGRNRKKGRRILTSERGRVEIELDGSFQIVGERINPTGKKKLQNELLAGNMDYVVELAREQAEHGASILDINVGMGGIDEEETMLKVIEQVGQAVSAPLCIDSSSPKVVEAALRLYPGRALVNSISCEKSKLRELLPVVKKYGAMFILLPLTDEGLPENQGERRQNIDCVLKAAFALGFTKEDIVVDGLVAAVGAQPEAAVDTLNTIGACKKEGLASICGLSNISFGLPDRIQVNGAFLSMAVSRGLTMAIANPSQELFVRTAFAADLLMGKENAAIRYVENCNYFQQQKERQCETIPVSELIPVQDKAGENGCSGHNSGSAVNSINKAAKETKEPPSILAEIQEDVRKGREKKIEVHVAEALKQGIKAGQILNQVLIPAITQVGDLFNRQIYFLPQLIISARAMEKGVAVLEPVLKESRGENEGRCVILATVKGDIHDIGKNLVAMMMRNHGFHVVDLGKDVDKTEIISAAKEYGAHVIGLSALMTTTMSYMKEVIEAVREQGLPAKIIVGGAAVTPEYAREIQADGYSADAVEAVELVKRLLEN